MYCKNCGALLSDDSLYCPSCGTTQDTVDSGNTLNELGKRIGAIQEVINEAFINENLAENEFDRIIRRKNSFLINLPLYLLVLLLVGIAGFFAYIYLFVDADIRFILILVIPPIVLAIVLVKVKNKLYIKHATKVAQEYYDQSQLVIAANREILSILPQTYWNPQAVNYIKELYDSNRVTSLPQALSLTDEYLHRCRVEQSFGEMKSQMDHMAKELKKTKEYAKEAESEARSAAWRSL